MKQMNVFFVMLLCCAGAFLSCSQDGDMVYSCNKEVDALVRSNLDEIRLMTRAEWKELDPDVSLAVYRAFTPDQKFDFWKGKFAEVKTLNWNEEELQHIQKAEDFLDAHRHLFDDEQSSVEDLDELDSFFYKWTKTAKEKFGWKEQVAFAIAGMGQAIIDTKGTIQGFNTSVNHKTKLSLGSESGTGTSDCNCKKDAIPNSCMPSSRCGDYRCNETGSGCGWLLKKPCDGRCVV